MKTKKAYLCLKSKICGNAWRGGWEQRCLLLAYAYLNGTPYVALERKINEDKFPNNGNYSFLGDTLAGDVAKALSEACESDFTECYGEVMDWMMEKYKEAEVAA